MQRAESRRMPGGMCAMDDGPRGAAGDAGQFDGLGPWLMIPRRPAADAVGKQRFPSGFGRVGVDRRYRDCRPDARRRGVRREGRGGIRRIGRIGPIGRRAIRQRPRGETEQHGEKQAAEHDRF